MVVLELLAGVAVVLLVAVAWWMRIGRGGRRYECA